MFWNPASPHRMRSFLALSVLLVPLHANVVVDVPLDDFTMWAYVVSLVVYHGGRLLGLG